MNGLKVDIITTQLHTQSQIGRGQQSRCLGSMGRIKKEEEEPLPAQTLTREFGLKKKRACEAEGMMQQAQGQGLVGCGAGTNLVYSEFCVLEMMLTKHTCNGLIFRGFLKFQCQYETSGVALIGIRAPIEVSKSKVSTLDVLFHFFSQGVWLVTYRRTR